MFEELRDCKDHMEVREYLNTFSKANLIAYIYKYYPNSTGVKWQSKTKKDLIQSIVNMYSNVRRDERMDHIKVWKKGVPKMVHLFYFLYASIKES